MAFCPACGHDWPMAAVSCPHCGYQADRSLEPAREPAAAASLPLADYLKAGWNLFQQYPWGFVGFFLVYVVIELLLNAIPLLGWLASAALAPALLIGNFLVSAKLLQHQTPEFQDFFLGFHFFLPLLVVALLTTVFITLGLVLLILPGVYLAVGYLFAADLVVDRRLDFWQAMELSRRKVHLSWFAFLALLLVLLLINLGGALLLGLGLLVTVPFTFCTLAVTYADVFGLYSDYSGKLPRLPEA
jgi:uncharacterized membrane protein